MIHNALNTAVSYMSDRVNTPVEIPKIISLDDHLVEPPHLWEQWLPKRFRASGPRVKRQRVETLGLPSKDETPAYRLDASEGEWCDVWYFEDLVYPTKRPIAAVGFPSDQRTLAPITYDEMRPGCYEPNARVVDMRENHVETSLTFPTFSRFCGQTFLERSNKDLSLACVRAYNDFMVEEWCADSNGALVPLIIIPLWDITYAVEEVRRNATRGCRAMCFSELPTNLGLPSIHSGYWDPLFRECQDTGIVVAMHIGSGWKELPGSPDAPPAVSFSLSSNNAAASLCDFLFSGVLVRFPGLKLLYSEAQIGWIPYILERVDSVWHEHRARAGVFDLVPEPPSTYYYRQVISCFFRDDFGLRSLDKIGIDNIAFETDYPHGDSTWPNSKLIATEMMSHLSTKEIWKIVRGNAARLLGLPIEGMNA